MNRRKDVIYYKTEDDIAAMRESCEIVSRTHEVVAAEIKPGITTKKLDEIAEEFIRSKNAEPAFLGYQVGNNIFPASLCISMNEEVVHGIPSDRVIQDGDVLSIDCGVYYNGFYGDQAYSYMVGEIPAETRKLLEVTYDCLYLGIEQAVVGNRLGDISFAVQKHAEVNGYGVVRELSGHGVGRNLHEKPEVPNYGKRGRGIKLLEGLVIAIEPMINAGTRKVVQLEDGWTVSTRDNGPFSSLRTYCCGS